MTVGAWLLDSTTVPSASTMEVEKEPVVSCACGLVTEDTVAEPMVATVELMLMKTV